MSSWKEDNTLREFTFSKDSLSKLPYSDYDKVYHLLHKYDDKDVDGAFEKAPEFVKKQVNDVFDNSSKNFKDNFDKICNSIVNTSGIDLSSVLNDVDTSSKAYTVRDLGKIITYLKSVRESILEL